MKSEEELQGELDDWLASQPTPPTILDVIRHGDVEIFGTFVLRAFRAAAAEAVRQNERAMSVRRSAIQLFEGDADSAEAWLRTASEQLGGKTPLSTAVDSEKGAEHVARLLDRLRR